MQLKRPTISTLIMIFLFLFSFFLLLWISTKQIISKENIEAFLIKIDIERYIKENKQINKVLEDNKIPKEVLDYIDENKINQFIKESLNNLYEENYIIKSSFIETLIEESIETYENKYTVDIYSHIKQEIIEITDEIANTINNEKYITIFNQISHIINGPYLYIIGGILLILIFSLFLLESKMAILLTGTMMTSLSIIMFYAIRKIITFTIESTLLSYDIKNWLIEYVISKITPIYSITFVIGSILLLIYLIIYVHRFVVKTRIKYYEKYYGR